MGFVIDLILLLAFVFSIVVAYKKGLLKSIVDTFGFIVSVFLASRVAEYVHLWIYRNLLKDRLIETVRQKIVESSAANQESLLFTDIKDFVSGFASAFGMDTAEISKGMAGIDLSATNAAELLVETAIQPIATVIIKCVLFLIFAVIFIAVLGVLGRFLSGLIKATPLKGINKILGGVFGILKGFVVVSLLTIIVLLLSALIENEIFDSMVSSSRILELLKVKSDIFKIN